MQIFKIFIVFFFLFTKVSAFEKVVIWGHKLHSHTHSYIHNAFYMAFKHLGYDVYWFDNQDNVQAFDFADSLFITEGQIDGDLPVRSDCYYVLHNCDLAKYKQLPKKNYLTLQVYTNCVQDRPGLINKGDFIYYDVEGRCVYMPWATDLLPFQIEEIKRQVSLKSHSNKIYWVGTIGDGLFGNIHQLNPFINACTENGIQFIQAIPNISSEENVRYIQNSYIAPTIVGKWQKEVGYIPCRIFKNISYGQFGVTNSKDVYELFEGKIIYNPDEYQLFYDAQQRMQILALSDLHELMDIVKTKHTYLNRIETILDFFEVLSRTAF